MECDKGFLNAAQFSLIFSRQEVREHQFAPSMEDLFQKFHNHIILEDAWIVSRFSILSQYMSNLNLKY